MGLAGGSSGAPGAIAQGDTDVLPVTHAPNFFYYLPRDPEHPELARAPRYPVSCVASASRCACYDQRAVLIDDLGEHRCRDLVAGRDRLAVLQPGNVWPQAAPQVIAPPESTDPEPVPGLGIVPVAPSPLPSEGKP
jgi:hypothetical protein